MKNGIYHELAIDLVEKCGLNMFTARKVVDLLKRKGLANEKALNKLYGVDNEV